MRRSGSNFNIHQYEEDLSPFGRRVLKVLINRWNTERQSHMNVSHQQLQRRFHRPTRDFTFDDANIPTPPPRPPPPPLFFPSSGVTPSTFDGVPRPRNGATYDGLPRLMPSNHTPFDHRGAADDDLSRPSNGTALDGLPHRPLSIVPSNQVPLNDPRTSTPRLIPLNQMPLDDPRTSSNTRVPTSVQMVTTVGQVFEQTGAGNAGIEDKMATTFDQALGEPTDNASIQDMLTSMQRTAPVEWDHMFDPQQLLRDSATPYSPQRVTSRRHRDSDSPPFSPPQLTPPIKIPKIQKQRQQLLVSSSHQKLLPRCRDSESPPFSPQQLEVSKIQQPRPPLSSSHQKQLLHGRILTLMNQTGHDEPVQRDTPIEQKKKVTKPVGKENHPDAIEKREGGVKKVPKANRKVQREITDTIPKKVKKLYGVSKNPFRKQKYTKAVTEWLNKADSALPPSELEAEMVPTKMQAPAKSPGMEQTPAALIPRNYKAKEKISPTTKVVQARLTNIGGVMKFGKPAAANKADVQVSNTSDEKVTEKVGAVKKAKKNVSDKVDVLKTSDENVTDKAVVVEKIKKKPVTVTDKTDVSSTSDSNVTNNLPTLKKIKKKSTDKVVVTNLNDENVTDKASTKKKINKKKFVAPLKSQLTQPSEGVSGLSNTTPSMVALEGPEPKPILSTDNADAVCELVPEGTVVVLVLLFSDDGRCELHESAGGGSSGMVGGVTGTVVLSDDGCWRVDGAEGACGEFLRHVVTRCRVVCFDGKAFLKYCMATLLLDPPRVHLNIMDMKVAGSLLWASTPPGSFAALKSLAENAPAATAPEADAPASTAPAAAAPASTATEANAPVVTASAALCPVVSRLRQLSGSTPVPSAAALAVSLRDISTKLVQMLKTRRQWKLYQDIEMKVLPIIAAMEYHGVPICQQSLATLEKSLRGALELTLEAAQTAAGAPVQPLAPANVRALLYDKLQLDKMCNLNVDTTPCNSDKSTSETMLRKLSHVHPLPRLILRYRRLHKALATSVMPIRRNSQGDVLRPTWHQCAVATGRISCTAPNAQALPKQPLPLDDRDDRADYRDDSTEGSDTDCNDDDDSAASADANASLSVRSVVRARSGYILLAADYRQVECRVLAAQADDETLRNALAADDLFTTLAAHWLHIPEQSVTSADRSRCKRCVYAAVYGCGAHKLASIIDSHAGTARAKDMLESFHRKFPGLRRWASRVTQQAASNGGTVRLSSGRALALPCTNSTDPKLRARANRQAVNFMVQGAAADLCKLAMIRCSEALACMGVEARLLLSLHDELVWAVKEDSVRAAGACVRAAMERCGQELGGSALMLQVALSSGPHWGDMRPLL